MVVWLGLVLIALCGGGCGENVIDRSIDTLDDDDDFHYDYDLMLNVIIRILSAFFWRGPRASRFHSHNFELIAPEHQSFPQPTPHNGYDHNHSLLLISFDMIVKELL